LDCWGGDYEQVLRRNASKLTMERLLFYLFSQDGECLRNQTLLSECLNCSREAINREIRKLKQGNVFTIKNNKVQINKDRLYEFAVKYNLEEEYGREYHTPHNLNQERKHKTDLVIS
jgi:hypothetical protein